MSTTWIRNTPTGWAPERPRPNPRLSPAVKSGLDAARLSVAASATAVAEGQVTVSEIRRDGSR